MKKLLRIMNMMGNNDVNTAKKITPVLLTGFEHGANSDNGGGLFTGTGGTGTTSIQSVVKHSGNYALKIVQTNNAAYKSWSLIGRYFSGRIYFYCDVLPSNVDADFFSISATGATAFLHYKHPDATLRMGWFGSASDALSSITPVVGQWYQLDFEVNTNVNPRILNWSINGVVMPQSTRATAEADLGFMRCGSLGTPSTQTYYFDDLLCTRTPGEYPIGPGYTEGLSPASDGIHNPGVNIMQNQAGTNIGATTAWDLLNSMPIGDQTKYLKQVAVGVDNYAEVQFSKTTHRNILGVSGILGYRSSSGVDVDEGGCILVDHIGTETTIYGRPAARQDYSEGVVFYKNGIPTPPANKWTKTAVNALKMRMGYSNNVTSIPYWVDGILEVAYV